MLSQWILRLIARWLGQRGIDRVADTLDQRLHGDVDALHDLARRALGRGDAPDALTYLHQATIQKPDDASLWCSIGAAHRHLGDYAAARTAYDKALTLRPNYPQVLSNLGEWCMAQNRTEEAVEWFDKALTLSPQLFEARLNKTAALYELARYADALALAEQLVKDAAHRPEAFLNLGNVLLHNGRGKSAIKQYKKALELQPGYAEAHFNLSSLLGSREDLGFAIEYLERRIKEKGDSVQNLCMLASAHSAAGHLVKAEELCNRVLERQPDNISALVTLGSCYSTRGESAEAVRLYERILALDKNQWGIGSNILFEQNNVPSVGRELAFQWHREWAQKLEQPFLERYSPAQLAERFAHWDKNPNRKLRIGYVSGDFVNHPVGTLLRDVLQRHDKSRFSIHCFSMVARPEDVLPELRAAADVWEDVFLLDDDELENRIQATKIDILVDLSGHTAFHRLPVFARKPAPVQVEWIGYFHSTGMQSMDYFITDPHTTPPNGGQLFSETPIYLPHTRFCYGPAAYAPEVAAPPVLEKGFITFGSFNRLAKVTDEVVAAWCQILHAVPRSRMVFKAAALAEESIAKRFSARFAQHGIDASRLELRETSPHPDMLAQYGDIDIALDTFPFNGGATTLEALWMGVPVVTIAGDTVVSRQTISALANIGLDETLAFADRDAYVQGAIALAHDHDRLKALRETIRPRMAASPLRQSEAFTRDLETLYRQMWCAFTQSASPSTP